MDAQVAMVSQKSTLGFTQAIFISGHFVLPVTFNWSCILVYVSQACILRDVYSCLFNAIVCSWPRQACSSGVLMFQAALFVRVHFVPHERSTFWPCIAFESTEVPNLMGATFQPYATATGRLSLGNDIQGSECGIDG